MIYGLCRLLLRDGAEAEDAARETCLSAQRSLLAGNEPRDAAAWLAAIARNECRARIRERMRAPLELVDTAAPSGDVEHAAAARAETRALCAALAELPSQQRNAVVLREFYGLSYDEAAVALGVSHSALESLLFRARASLQERLRPARLAHGALTVPAALKEALAAAVPGFGSASASAASAASAGGGISLAASLTAKLVAAPVAAKIAAATVAASVAVTGAAVAPAARNVLARSEGAPVREALPQPAAPETGRRSGTVAPPAHPVSAGDAPLVAEPVPEEWDWDSLGWNEPPEEPVGEEPPAEELPPEEAPLEEPLPDEPPGDEPPPEEAPAEEPLPESELGLQPVPEPDPGVWEEPVLEEPAPETDPSAPQ
jgi:RNA polymerase sigma factor (sigma-70 family)